MKFFDTYRLDIGIALFALCVHVACFLVVARANPDTLLETIHADDAYYEIAVNMLSGNGFSSATTSPYVPNALRTPGYIFFLVGLFATGGEAMAVIVQILVASLIPVFGMRIAQSITHSPRIGLVAGMILALDPTLALLSFRFYTDTLFLLLFLAWMLLAMRYLRNPAWGMLVGGSFLLGLAILTRPTAQYIPLLFALFILWQSGRREWLRGARHALAFLAIVAVIVGPWVARNYYEFGAPGLSAQRQYVLYTNFAPAVLSVARGSDFTTEFTTFSTQAERDGGVITPANGSEYTAQALEIALSYPLASTYVMSRSLFTFFTNDGFYTLLSHFKQEPREFLWLLIPARLAWIAIALVACIGAFVYLYRGGSALAVLLILLVAYFALTSIVAAFGTNPRYRLPVDPVLLALAMIGGAYLFEQIRHALRPKYSPQHTV